MSSSRVRALLVDDSQLMRDLLRMVLRKDPHIEVVAEAANGQEAIKAAQEHQPDVVFLDIRMPVMDGYEALPGILAAAPDARVIVVSGLDRAQAAPRAFELGAHAFVEKDIPPQRFQQDLLALAHRAGGPATGLET